MSEPVDVLVAANAVIRVAKVAGLDITHLKLQKILYFAYAIFLVEENERLLDAEFEAWQYGPVIRELYAELKPRGASELVDPIRVVDPATGVPLQEEAEIDEKRLAFLQRITLFYGKLTSGQLVSKSHATGGPWSVTVEEAERELNVGMIISDETIRKYYRQQWLGANLDTNTEQKKFEDDHDTPIATRGFR
ncbi:type VI toxin-antitoxin system SocA family antitoxin [Hyphomonas johnsonii]|uniref:Antitoxin SocA-like Panacea domain-containing protein n=1 Tax=Hyphomonas johnsonii MHS-2 TaxID=1280950 RepID=A0A059FE27_9PROT|nr:type II toxin-antitoxin system antitoxin SocA domain-containing protein [Hyphomonas johnsonii]KCZ88874.1 hypothetical protein HJO_15194 [Hyphomonas johnsonii MHS-2]